MMTRSVSQFDSVAAASKFDRLVTHVSGKIAAGEPIDIAALTADCPEQREQLEMLLPTLEAIADLGHSIATSQDADHIPASKLTHTSPGILGDFRIVREIGRGGMGVVYETEQISLGRRVALKVLPFAAMLDNQQLARFKNEARAAATLDHPNIVAIYSVGSERSVHYYAMQLIEGQSLAQVIAQLKPDRPPLVEESALTAALDPAAVDTAKAALPTVRTKGSATFSSIPLFESREFFRAAARLGIQAAEALDHAHQNGILHRDIKPANLLVDDTGKLWITDFGLARIEQDAGMTMTGDLLGTLRYMSPEQALGRRVVVDNRSDIYSLGVTLYELLTLRPAYATDDRQELLRQIAFEDPRPPRQFNPQIPADFETILLKTISKSPVARYATAQNLADDLKRFLSDQPILARRPSIIARVRKLGRRHAALLTTGAAAAVVGLAVAAGTIGWAIRDREARHALSQRQAALALDEASRFSQQTEWSSAQAAVRRAQAIVAGDPGNVDLERQLDALSRDIEMALRLEQISLDLATTNHRDGDIAFEEAIPQYAAAFREYGIDAEQMTQQEVTRRIRASSIASELCSTLDVWAYRLTKVNGTNSFSDELATIAKEAETDQWRRRLREANALPVDERRRRLIERAAEALDSPLPAQNAVLVSNYLYGAGAKTEAEALLRSAILREPDHFWPNFTLGSHCLQMEPPQLDDAIRFLSTATALRPNCGVSYNNLGTGLLSAGRQMEAIECFQQAVRLQPSLAKPHYNLAIALRDAKQFHEAETHFQEAIHLLPESGMFRTGLGKLFYKQRAYEKALACLQEAIRLEPGYAPAHHALGDVQLDTGELDEAIASFRKALRLGLNRATLHNALAVALARQRKLDEAIPSFRQAIELEPNVAVAHFSLAEALRVTGAVDESIASYREVTRLDPNSAGAYASLGNIYFAKADWDQAIECFRNVVRLRPENATAQYNLGNSLCQKGAYDEAIKCLAEAIRLKSDYPAAHSVLGNAHYQKGEFDQAVDQYTEALRLDPKSAATSSSLGAALHHKNDLEGAIIWHRKALELDPTYALARQNLASALRDKDDYEPAVKSFEEAIRLDPKSASALAEYAWLLLTAKNESFRDAKKALEMATQAIELNSKEPGNWRTLGAAHYRTGNWQLAREAYMKVIESGKEVSGSTLLLLAMTQWRLGDQDGARTAFDKAVKAMKKNKRADYQFPQLRQEAETLLQIKSTNPPNETPLPSKKDG